MLDSDKIALVFSIVGFISILFSMVVFILYLSISLWILKWAMITIIKNSQNRGEIYDRKNYF